MTSEPTVRGPFADVTVGVVVSDLSIQGGAEMVARELAESFDAPIYTLRYDPQRFDGEFRDAVESRVVVVTDFDAMTPVELDSLIDSDVPFAQWTSPTAELGARQYDVEEFVDQDRLNADVLVACDNDGTLIAYQTGTPYVTYLHHPAKRYNDYFWEELEAHDGLREKLSFAVHRFRYSRKLKGVTRRSDRVLVNSLRTRDRTREVWGIPDEDMDVVYPPVDTETFTPGEPDDILGLDRYFLAPQRLEAYKNVHVLVEAAKRAGEHLVLAGVGRLEDYVRREAQYSTHVHCLGYVNDEQLRDLYRGAEATVQGTLREDFGIVPVESMACGTPCLLPASGGFLETVGNGPGTEGAYTTDRGQLLDPEEFGVETVAEAFESFDASAYDETSMVEAASAYNRERFVDEMEATIRDVVA